ncbi:MAG TPA: protein-disulfide reductase DsbD domain-containing protein [Terriglobales bacterium]|jgi:hypothetical protein
MRKIGKTIRAVIFGITAALCTLSYAQDSPGSQAPSVTMAPPGITNVTRGTSGKVELQFRIMHGFHINSNAPTEEYLIPTALNMEAPTDIVVGRITYPDGQNITLPFAPDLKLNVYSGDFSILVNVRPLSSVIPGKYALHGRLKYQACDKAACYPPKEMPVTFEVKVVKGAPAAVRRNPAQSPHAHY